MIFVLDRVLNSQYILFHLWLIGATVTQVTGDAKSLLLIPAQMTSNVIFVPFNGMAYRTVGVGSRRPISGVMGQNERLEAELAT